MSVNHFDNYLSCFQLTPTVTLPAKSPIYNLYYIEWYILKQRYNLR